MISIAKKGFVFILIMLVTSEVFLYFLNKNDIIRTYSPSYKFNQPFWSDINEKFGVWHSPNSEFVHSTPCFSLTYNSNSYGMRDIEREKEGSGRRFVVIGDSFVEGFGVSSDNRFTNKLEEKLQYQFLNFGTSGVFGMTQAALLYDSLASDFYHTDLIISVLPYNDFMDDDIKYGKAYYTDRYRPYLTGDYPNYKIEYFNDSISSGRSEEKLHRKIMSFFREFTYTYNFMVMIRDRLIVNIDEESLETLTKDNKSIYSGDWSGFNDIDNNHLNKLLWSLEKISKKAILNNKNVYLFLIPAKSDIEKLKNDNATSKLQNYLFEKLPLLQIKYIPLTEKFIEKSIESDNMNDFFHTCDDHWSNKGNAFTMKVIENYLNNE